MLFFCPPLPLLLSFPSQKYRTFRKLAIWSPNPQQKNEVLYDGLSTFFLFGHTVGAIFHAKNRLCQERNINGEEAVVWVCVPIEVRKGREGREGVRLFTCVRGGWYRGGQLADNGSRCLFSVNWGGGWGGDGKTGFPPLLCILHWALFWVLWAVKFAGRKAPNAHFSKVWRTVLELGLRVGW